MIGMLAGSSVRDRDGLEGKIVSWVLPEVTIGWNDGHILPREETFDQANPRLRTQIEVLSLDAGWVPLGNFMSVSGLPTPGHSTVTQMRKLIGEADALLEKGKEHWPYKNKSKLGPGPRGGENSQTDGWNCKCANYKCACKGPEGKKRTIVIDKGYKKAYNKEYKAWRAKQG
jgi:hypothetical protein